MEGCRRGFAAFTTIGEGPRVSVSHGGEVSRLLAECMLLYEEFDFVALHVVSGFVGGKVGTLMP